MNDQQPTVMDIGPADAQFLLTNSNHQRPKSKRTIARYAKDMREGRWRLTYGNPIAIFDDKEGVWGAPNQVYVLNGMHRLHAIIESGTTQRFLVVYETDPTLFDTYDTGLVRNMGTLVAMSAIERGVDPSNTGAIATTANLVLRYDLAPKTLWQPDTVTKTQFREWVDNANWAELIITVRDYHQLRAVVKTTGLGNWYSALRFLVHRDSAHADRWYEFHQSLVNGANLKEDDVRLKFRNYLMRPRQAKTSHWQRQSELAIGIKAWNAFIEGTKKDLFIFRKDELAKSGMPKIL